VPLIDHLCTLCCRPTSMWCGRCQSAWYCSSEHLHDDWARHRQECIPASGASYIFNMIASPPPAEDRLVDVSTILLAPDEERPQIININHRPSHQPAQGI
ncbi:hypothetical protein C8J56DRAFT_724208, partial [Mycena floridula]